MAKGRFVFIVIDGTFPSTMYFCSIFTHNITFGAGKASENKWQLREEKNH
jgi:hypothetical protein